MDVTLFLWLLPHYLFLQALRLIAVFRDSDMGKAIMTASSLHTQPVEGINPCLVCSIDLISHCHVFLNIWEIVGLSLREQLQSTAVPIDESDWKLDMLVTPDEVIGGL